MWKPSPRVRHAPFPLSAPTLEEVAHSRLFSPLTLASGLTLLERTWVPAMVPWRATEDGFASPDVLDWYGRFAEGEPGAIVVEATGIRDVPSGPLLRIGHDRFIPGLTRLTDRVREASGGRTKLFIQIIDFLRIRRRPSRQKFLLAFLALRPEHRQRVAEKTGDASLLDAPEAEVRGALLSLADAALADILDERELEALRMGARERVTDVDVSDIRELPKTLPGLFADAAVRAQKAGFDGVELHFAHAYTMASFLSAKNTRSDGYGTTREGRLRLPSEVFYAVRSAVGGGFTVGARLLCDEIIEGGSTVDDAAFFATGLARAGLDFVSLSTGGKFEDAKQPKEGEAAYPYTGQSGFECMPTAIADARGPYARNVPKQAEVRRALRHAGLETPVVVAGGICDFAQAEGILQRGEGDLIGAARQSLADPDWWKKVRTGRGMDVRRCIYSNYCEALDQHHRAVTCQLWDRVDQDEPGIRLVDDGRRRLIAPRGR